MPQPSLPSSEPLDSVFDGFESVLGLMLQRSLYGMVFLVIVGAVLWLHYRVFLVPHIGALADQVSYLRERVETLERRLDLGGKP